MRTRNRSDKYRRKARQAYTIQLREKEEADLILWLDEVPNGERLGVIRDALRAYKNSTGADVRRATVADLNNAQNTLGSWMNDMQQTLLEQLSGGIATAPDSAIGEVLQMLRALEAKVGTLGAVVPTEPIMESVDQLNSEELRRRDERLRANKKTRGW